MAALAALVVLVVQGRDILNLNLVARLVRLGHRAELTQVLAVLVVLAVMVVFLARVATLEQQVQRVLMAIQEVAQRVVVCLLWERREDT